MSQQELAVGRVHSEDNHSSVQVEFWLSLVGAEGMAKHKTDKLVRKNLSDITAGHWK